MLNIIIRVNDNNVAEYIMQFDTESYKDPFVNNKDDIHTIMVNTAEKLGFMDKGKSFKSLEFISHDLDRASVIYNDSKLVDLKYTSDYGVIYICGLGTKANSDNLSAVFILKDVVRDVKH